MIRSLEAGDSINNSELTEEYGKVEKMANLACVTSVTVIMLEKVFRIRTQLYQVKITTKHTSNYPVTFVTRFSDVLHCSVAATVSDKSSRNTFVECCFFSSSPSTRLPVLFIAVNLPNLVHKHWEGKKTVK